MAMPGRWRHLFCFAPPYPRLIRVETAVHPDGPGGGAPLGTRHGSEAWRIERPRRSAPRGGGPVRGPRGAARPGPPENCAAGGGTGQRAGGSAERAGRGRGPRTRAGTPGTRPGRRPGRAPVRWPGGAAGHRRTAARVPRGLSPGTAGRQPGGPAWARADLPRGSARPEKATRQAVLRWYRLPRNFSAMLRLVNTMPILGHGPPGEGRRCGSSRLQRSVIRKASRTASTKASLVSVRLT